jgi:hypothetical protein
MQIFVLAMLQDMVDQGWQEYEAISALHDWWLQWRLGLYCGVVA